MTTAELQDATGRGDKWVRDRLRVLLNAGKVRRTKKMFTKIDGTAQLIAAYEFTGE